MKTYSEMKKTINCYIDTKELFLEAEGKGWQGWFCPIWAKISEEENEITLYLGSPVSGGTLFVDNNGNTPLSWVGSIQYWERYWKEDDAEAWAEENDCDAEDFDCDAEAENEVENWGLREFVKELERRISEYAKSEGYDFVEYN